MHIFGEIHRIKCQIWMYGISFQYEPVIEKSHETMVHHIMVYACTPHAFHGHFYEGRQFDCLGGDRRWFYGCSQVIIPWAKGAKVSHLTMLFFNMGPISKSIAQQNGRAGTLELDIESIFFYVMVKSTGH